MRKITTFLFLLIVFLGFNQSKHLSSKSMWQV